MAVKDFSPDELYEVSNFIAAKVIRRLESEDKTMQDIHSIVKEEVVVSQEEGGYSCHGSVYNRIVRLTCKKVREEMQRDESNTPVVDKGDENHNRKVPRRKSSQRMTRRRIMR